MLTILKHSSHRKYISPVTSGELLLYSLNIKKSREMCDTHTYTHLSSTGGKHKGTEDRHMALPLYYSHRASNLLDELCSEDKDMHLRLNCPVLAQHVQETGHLHFSLSSAYPSHKPLNLAAKSDNEVPCWRDPYVSNSPWLLSALGF